MPSFSFYLSCTAGEKGEDAPSLHPFHRREQGGRPTPCLFRWRDTIQYYISRIESTQLSLYVF